MSAACTSELDESISELNGIYLDLNFTTAETRANLNPDGTGSFSEGDKIGLYINNNTSVEYREVTLTNGIWQPRLRRSDFGEDPLTLSAHYPILPDGKPIRITNRRQHRRRCPETSGRFREEKPYLSPPEAKISSDAS